MAGMSGGSMLRARRKDVNIKPNRRLDRKSSRGMIYENEELRLRTININAEVERGQTDIKKLKRENEQLRREVGALRGEYDRLERLLHQRQDKESPERQDDEKASFSCCSDCESDCCDVQNDANAAWDCPGHMSGSSLLDHGEGGPCCGGMGGEPLSSVPEEPNSPRGPPDFLQVIPTCRCQPTPSELKSSDCGFTTSNPPREFFTAVVTVPLASHLPTTPPPISMAPAMVFPKTGLDILINNNTFENFETFTLPPPIGFVVPPPPLHEPSDEEPFQIVPNVELTHTPEVKSSHLPELMFHIPGTTSQQQGFMPLCQELTTHFNESPVVFSDNVVMCRGLHQTEDIPNNENFDCSSGTLSYSNTVIPFGQDSICGFQNGGNIEDLLGDLDSVSSGGDFVKDSIFVCKTRKVIQQLTTVQNSVGTGCGCNCRCNVVNQTELAQAPDVVIIDSNSNGSQFFRTEKNIELNYDYPKTVINNGVCEPSVELSGESLGSQDVFGRNVDLTQTTHTTTEVNSTVMMFRKKNPLKSKSKFPLFGRSHSAPVETVSDEPIYATVKKLPKKLKRLNIRNLENEIRYVPPEEPKVEEKKEEEVKVEAVVEEPVVPEVKEEVIDVAPKTNGVAHKSSMKADSLSESSEKGNLNPSTNTIPKSPLVRKKKRFSIHFKRKSSKTSSKTSIKEEMAEQTELEAPVVKNDMLEIDIKSSESDKLIEASSSPDSPDTVKFKQHPPVFCKKHGKPKHCRENYPQHSNHVHLSHCGTPKPRRREEGYPHHGCLLHKSGSDRSTDLAMKKGFHPSKSYFKQDSYQEMTTSHSERERTNSLSSSGHSGFSLGSKPRSMSTSRREDNIPWCGCWGNSCL